MTRSIFHFCILSIAACISLFSCTKEERVQLELSDTQLEVVSPKVFFNVTANREWTLSQSGNYNFDIAPTSGVAGTTAVNITYSPNDSGQERSSTLTITAGGISESIVIKQPALEFVLSPNKLEFESSGSTKSINVTSNTSWNIDGVNPPEWITLIAASNTSGNGEIEITAKENDDRKEDRTWIFRVNYDVALSKAIEVVQKAAYNASPTKPSGLVPENNATNISIIPRFSWNASTDQEGDRLQYHVHLSTDGTNWKRYAAGQATGINLLDFNETLEPTAKYYYKVTADDGYNNGVTESDIQTFTTSSKDIYADGEYIEYITSSKSKPIVLIFTGDGYIDEDYKIGGAFDKDANEAIEAFFNIEPYKSYKEYFTVYKIAAYSKERGITNIKTSSVKDTKFNLEWEGGNSTGISCPNSGAEVLSWCKKIPGVTSNSLKNTTIGIVVNADIYAGTCLSFSDGKSIAMIPYLRNSRNSMTKFANVVRHEMGGHGFGRLADEYINYQSSIPSDEKSDLLLWQQNYNYSLNISAYPSMADSPWAHFADRSDYSHVGMYEGANYYATGVWRPEVSSCMIDNRQYYNSPSRFYIVKRILEISGEVTPITSTDSEATKAQKMKILMDKFIAKDVQKTDNTATSANTKGGWGGVPYDFVPLAPPILKID